MRHCARQADPLLPAAHRTQRPWQGAQEKGDGPQLPDFDEKCYLCPGNERATGGRNDKYDGTFVSARPRRVTCRGQSLMLGARSLRTTMPH